MTELIEPIEPESRPARRAVPARKPVAPDEVALSTADHDDVLRRAAARRRVRG
ncbi:hypothetical protein [Pseudonocardia pini]|uniref:hypothetical protein n=1 Tax=Pseudonocardia pini TaxID=2758030 RepID=UPI0015F11E16|nr:hypothetical protein [Pseudonocardia pini]